MRRKNRRAVISEVLRMGRHELVSKCDALRVEKRHYERMTAADLREELLLLLDSNKAGRLLAEITGIETISKGNLF